MIINHNLSAMNAHRQLGANQANGAKAQEKLSSGLRINRAGDDAAGLAISEKMRAQVRGLDQASTNAQDGISLIQTAEGALSETHSILQRMRELATQASNDTNTDSDRNEIQKEMNSLTSEINRIGNTTEFNTQKLLNGDKDGTSAKAVQGVYTYAAAGGATITIDDEAFTFETDFDNLDELVDAINQNTDLNVKYTATKDGTNLVLTQLEGAETDTAPTGATHTVTTAGIAQEDAVADPTNSLKFQIGANENQSLTLDIADMRAVALGISSVGTTDADLGVTNGTNNTVTEQALNVSTHDSAAAAITTIQSAIDQVSAERSKLGANQNRLEHTISNLNNSSENLQAAESRIRDVDMAKEIMEFTKNNILSQASQSMLAQANQAPQQVLQLLG
ncbi:flagellin [Alkalihalobacillus sp. FSL W8-0930]